MASLTLDKTFFTDERIEYLSRHCREDKLMTEARLARLYLACMEQKNELVTWEIINFTTQWTGEEKFAEKMVEAKLAEESNTIGCYRIKGVKERLKLSQKRATAGKKGGNATAKIKNLMEMTEPDSMYEKIVWLWNNKVAEKIGKAKVSVLDDKRIRLINRGLGHFPEIDAWKHIMEQVVATTWCHNPEISFTFDTVFRSSHYIKFKEAFDSNADGGPKTNSLDNLYKTEEDFSKEHMDFVDGKTDEQSEIQ